MHDILDWKNLEPQYARLYSKYFSDTEMRQIGAFYKTPVGIKMNRLMPDLSAEAMMISQELIKKNTGKITKLFTTK